MENAGLRIGASLAEESCGTNSVALVMRLMRPVGCLAENNFCSALQFFTSYVLPLRINEQIVGYLNVNAVNNRISQEQTMLGELQRHHLIEEYQKLNSSMDKNYLSLRLTDKQLNILKLLVRGFKEEMIIKMLDLNPGALADQKMIIYKELGMEAIPRIRIMNSNFKLMVSE